MLTAEGADKAVVRSAKQQHATAARASKKSHHTAVTHSVFIGRCLVRVGHLHALRQSLLESVQRHWCC